MAPLDTGKPVLANLRSVTGLPDLPQHAGKDGPTYPSTPGGAKRRAEIAMSIINGMSSIGESIAQNGLNGSVSGRGHSTNGRPAFRN